MKYPAHMNRCWIALLLVTLIGCEESAPVVVPAVIPKDAVRVQPGPVDPDAPEEFTETESGLKYRIRRKSEGKKPTDADIVRVHYRGWFDDGKIFDSSYGNSGNSYTIRLNGVIKGWTEGLQLIGEGGMIELLIPPDLAYGPGERAGMPANATLHFLIELLEVTAP